MATSNRPYSAAGIPWTSRNSGVAGKVVLPKKFSNCRRNAPTETNPIPSKYLYYVSKNDGTDLHYFATTEAEHIANIKRAAGNGGS